MDHKIVCAVVSLSTSTQFYNLTYEDICAIILKKTIGRKPTHILLFSNASNFRITTNNETFIDIAQYRMTF